MNVTKPVKNASNAVKELSRQSQLVLASSMVPVLVALSKYRWIDAAVMALAGLLATYNMSCIAGSKACTTWAWILAVVFAVMTAVEHQLLPGPKPEFMKSEEEKKDDGAKNMKPAEDEEEVDEEDVL